jgi:two-component system, LuxR family, sensor kinase FixL
MQLSEIYSRANRKTFLMVGALLIVGIAIADSITPNLPLGYLYLFPILFMAGFLPRPQIALLVLLCAGLTVLMSRFDFKPATILFVMSSLGFSGTALFVSEIVINRQKALEYVHELETQIRLRQETEGQLKGLVDSSPLAIITVDADGRILLANEAAQNLFEPGGTSIAGQPIAGFLPALQTVTQQPSTKVFRTQIRCRGKRKNGDIFLAAVWFSTSTTTVGNIVSAIIVDFSEEVRDREDLSLEHLLKNAKILVGAMAHEIRNLCGAALVVYRNLSRLHGMPDNEDFRALGALITGLENLSSMELRPAWGQGLAAVELSSVLDELRVVIGPSFNEAGVEILWKAQEHLPLAIGDRYGLLQVFLNLARNSQRAMEMSERRQLTISSAVEPSYVVIRFEDTGVGIPDPSGLFRPFAQSANAAGLGLYVSRAILRSFRGDLQHEPRSEGCCFAVSLARYINAGDIA